MGRACPKSVGLSVDLVLVTLSLELMDDSIVTVVPSCSILRTWRATCQWYSDHEPNLLVNEIAVLD
eukprot:scaffold746_cov123-Cylindrotheca_fusiformis.AAC.20